MKTGRLLEIRNLSTHYVSARGTRVVRAVDEVSLSINAGETLGIVGEFGSGKSTLALTIMRVLPPAARIVGGRMLFEGEDLLRKSDEQMRRIRGKRIAMILQDPMASLNPLFTVGDQVAEPIRVHEGAGRATAWARARELLKAVRIPSPETRLTQYPHEMSGGMRQRIVGAIGISCEPRLLIADEPTTSLDLTTQAQYLNLLRELQRAHGVALIFITHNLGIVAKMCDRLAVMYAGRVVEFGTGVAALQRARPSLYRGAAQLDPADDRRRTAAHCHRRAAARFGGIAAGLRLRPALRQGLWTLSRRGAARIQAGTRPGRRPDGALLARRPRGRRRRRRLASRYPRRRGLMVVLEASGLSKHFRAKRGVFGGDRGVVRAVDGISFTVESGRTLGVVGESGCGKTTTAKLVLGLEEPTSGIIRFEGRDLQRLDTAGRRHYRKSVQAVFQDPYASLNPRMRVGAIIAEPLVANEFLPAAEVRGRVLDLLDLVGLPARSANLFPHEFSGGQRQRIAIARALALSPRLIVLDEPVSALDVSIRAQILNLLRDLQAQLGLSYLFIAHDLAAVAHMSHTIAVMYLGKIVEAGEARTLARAPKHPYTKALFSAALPSHPNERREEIILTGEVPSPLSPPSGCRFHPRCPHAMARCAEEGPVLSKVEGRLVACHLYDQGARGALKSEEELVGRPMR